MIKMRIAQFLLLCFIQQPYSYTMEKELSASCNEQYAIDYGTFFTLCKNNQEPEIYNFLKANKNNPAFNINYQNEHGETALIYAASWNAWSCVNALLQYQADKNLKDKYGQSLFSKSVYTERADIFKKTFKYYSEEEINTECKTIALSRNVEYQIVPEVSALITDVLNGKKIDATTADAKALLLSCTHQHFPHIMSFLKKNRNFTLVTYKDQELQELQPKALFVIREAFNNECRIPYFIALIYEYLQMCIKIEDVRKIIKQYYMQLLAQNFFESVEAILWKPICIKACELNNIQKTEKDHCLLHILLLLSQKEKTKFNQTWYLEEEKNKAKISIL